MYKQGKQKEIDDNKKQVEEETGEKQLDSMQDEEYDFENPLEDSKFLDMDDGEFDTEVKELIEWSEQLDFDSYLREWDMIATSAKSNDFVPEYKPDVEQLTQEGFEA